MILKRKREIPPIRAIETDFQRVAPQLEEMVRDGKLRGAAMEIFQQLEKGSTVVNVLNEYGNCIAAALPMALAHANREGRLNRGDLVLLLGSGAGISIAGTILRW